MNSFNDLEVWKSARELRKSISILTKSFPKEERYRLIDQIIRSSRSVAANIAEGYWLLDFIRHLSFAICDFNSCQKTCARIFPRML